MALEVDNITAGYGPITVLRGVSLRVGPGEILGVLGRNGMGKSTLIRCISGLVPASAGAIRLGDRDITRLPPHARARQGITTIVQGRGIFPRLSVRENLEMGRIAAGVPRRSRLEEVLGEKLFVRQGRHLALTESGRVAFRYANEIFSLGREFVDTLKGRASGRPLRLVVGVADVLPPSLVRRFLEPAFRLGEAVHVICRADKSVEEFIAELALHRGSAVVLAVKATEVHLHPSHTLSLA